MGSKCRRHAYFRELRVLTCVGDLVHFRVHSTSSSRPRTFKHSGRKTTCLALVRRGDFNFPAHLKHAILLLSISSREGLSPSPRPSLVFVSVGERPGRVLSAEKEHFYSQMWLWKEQHLHEVGSSNILRWENIVNRDLAEQGRLKRNPAADLFFLFLN